MKPLGPTSHDTNSLPPAGTYAPFSTMLWLLPNAGRYAVGEYHWPSDEELTPTAVHPTFADVVPAYAYTVTE